MKPTDHRTPARSTLALGLVAGAWVALSGFAPAVEAPLPAPMAVAPDRIHVAQADAVPADKPVTFSKDQADRGKKKFASDCVDCHGEDLRGGLNGGPPLKGLAFDALFAEGSPASALFGFMSTAMPPDSPGRFSANTYADLMAYVLQQNGYQAGAELPSDLDALDHLIMQK